MRLILFLLIASLAANLSFAKGKKQSAMTIAFHTEAANLESKKLTFEIETPKGKRFMSKTPFITTSDIVAYNAFPSPHNPDMYGVSFQLNRAGASRLKMTSGQYAGKWIMCTINGNVVDMLYIDRQVDGRVITIWRGVDKNMLNACNFLIPRIGESEKAWKTRLKYEKKQ
ncbi:MAG: hypothetical protein ABGY95_06150 [Rubritalea sp.]|uniref:hypothetical protein n=1 Tax=Rubritalea sp. TaxID=2109375 RepID=UPI0032428690